MPNQISNWSKTSAEKICWKYIKDGIQQQDLKKTKQALKFSLPTEPS